MGWCVVHLWRGRLSDWNKPDHRTEQSVRMILFIAVVVSCGTGGDIAVSHAMKKIGVIESFRPASICRVLFRAFRIGWMWLGIALMAVSFFSLLALLSWAPVSIVVPA